MLDVMPSKLTCTVVPHILSRARHVVLTTGPVSAKDSKDANNAGSRASSVVSSPSATPPSAYLA